MKDINWAVLGTGVIANEMAVALKKNGKNIYAVGNRTYEKAVAFCEKYGIGKVYADYNEMFTDPEVDVIYITTPHNTHKKFSAICMIMCGNFSAMCLDNSVADRKTDSHATVGIRCTWGCIFAF